MWCLLGLFLAIIIAVFWIYWAQAIGAGWSPTPREIVDEMLNMAKINSSDTLFDLGSGDGRILMMAAARFGIPVIGIEADPIRFLVCFIKVKAYRLSNVRILWGNFFHVNLSEATVVITFLSDKANQRLKNKFQQELRAGTRVVSYHWKYTGWTPVRSNPVSGVYVYEI